jgi:ankyrin repeat protein
MKSKNSVNRIRFSIGILILLGSLNTVAQTPLAKALASGDTSTAIRLINAGENPNQKTEQGSLLSLYCRYSEADPMAFFLLRYGAKPDTFRSPAGRSALHIAAAYYACEPLCEALLKAGAHINARTKDGATPLMLAALSAKLRLVKFLIEHGANVKAKDKKGKTAYDYALRADAMNDMPDVQKNLEKSCGFNKPATIAFLKEKMN